VVEREEESCGEETEEGGDSEELVEEEGTDDDFEGGVDLVGEGRERRKGGGARECSGCGVRV